MDRIKIGIVDDEALFRQGLKLLLEDYSDMEIVFSVPDGNTLLEILKEGEQDVDIILLDLKLAGMSGIETAKRVVARHPNVKVIILSTYYNETFVYHIFELGVSAYVPKNTNPDTVVRMIRKVNEQGYFFSDYIMSIIRDGIIENKRIKPKYSNVPELSQREQEVLRLICDQFTTQEISEQLGISKRTVDGHRVRLIEKTGARNIAGLIIYAIYHNLVDVDIDSIINEY